MQTPKTRMVDDFNKLFETLKVKPRVEVLNPYQYVKGNEIRSLYALFFWKKINITFLVWKYTLI
jgi:hypothetical protein